MFPFSPIAPKSSQPLASVGYFLTVMEFFKTGIMNWIQPLSQSKIPEHERRHTTAGFTRLIRSPLPPSHQQEIAGEDGRPAGPTWRISVGSETQIGTTLFVVQLLPPL